MKRDYFSSGPRYDHRPADQRSGTCMALIDGRFLVWLAQQGALGTTGESVNRQGLLGLLSHALSHTGLDVDLRRIYWYSDRSDGLVIDDQIVRLVQAHDADGGSSLLRSLGHDLKQLAEHHACDHVLVASDDERFLSAIDEAQLSGLSVHLLADDSARNMTQMVRTDPAGPVCCRRRTAAWWSIRRLWPTSCRARHPRAWAWPWKMWKSCASP